MKIPDWFSLAKYEICASFTFKDWYRELVGRAIAIAHFQDEIEYKDNGSRAPFGELLALLLPLVRASGTFKAMEQSLGDQGRDRVFELRSSSLVSESRFRSPVRDLSQFDLAYLLLVEIPEPDRTLADMRALIDAPVGPKEPRISLAKRFDVPVNNWIDAAEAAFDQKRSEAIVKVDLKASDEVLVKAFQNWLEGQRRQLGQENKGALSDSLRQKWHRQRVLPYLDLWIWQLSEGQTIPLHRIADALYPDELDIDTTERLRKVTRPRAEELVSLDFLDNRLLPQANAEAAIGSDSVGNYSGTTRSVE